MSTIEQPGNQQRNLERAQELIVDQKFDAAREYLDAAIQSGSPQALYLSALWHALQGDQQAHYKGLREAAEAGDASAIGESAGLDLMDGQIGTAIERLSSIPIPERTASIWVVLSWALLLADRSNEQIEELDDYGLQEVLQEPAPFPLLAGLHEQAQIGLLANHIACALLNRGLTQYESDLLQGLTEQQEGVSELILIAARIAQIQGDKTHCNALLDRIPSQDIETLRSEVDQALSLTAPDSRAHDHFNALNALLNLNSAQDIPQDSDASIATLRLILDDSNTTGCELASHDPDRCRRRRAASNPQIPLEVLSNWAVAGDSCLKLGVADNPNSTVELLESLAQADELPIRNAILGRSELPLGTLITGVVNSWSDENYDDFHSLPLHYDYTKMLRDMERGSNEPRIKSILDGNAPGEVLQEAWRTVLTWTDFGDTNHPSDGHMAALAVNFVKQIVTSTQDARWIFESLMDPTEEDPRLLTAVVKGFTYEDAQVTVYTRNEPVVFQAAVAVQHRSLPQESAVDFARACPWDVRLVLALKPETDPETLTAIFESSPPDYVEFGRPDVSAYFDAGIPWNDMWPTEMGVDSLDDYLEIPEQSILRSVALGLASKHPNFPHKLLVDAAHSADPVIRSGAARSLKAPQELLRQLAVDPITYVRQGVAANSGASEETRALAQIQGA